MSEWIVVFIIIPAIATLLGVVLTVAAHFFAVKKDERVSQILELLPGANCGACGFPGCSGFASALVAEGVSPLKCKSLESSNTQKIAAILGQQISANKIKEVAYVFCKGGNTKTKRKFNYIGLKDCRAKYIFFKGEKGCSFGCLGGGSCIKKCPANAISIKENIAVVNPAFCIGCGACVDVCPSKVIRLIPSDAKIAVACNSTDKGGVVKSYCSVGCIGCKICEKNSENKIVVSDFLAQIDYGVNPDFSSEQQEMVVSKCPAKAIVKL